MSETINVPQITRITSMTLPNIVLGKKSPYPTVVIVIIVSQRAF
jgi:hypothetical protein